MSYNQPIGFLDSGVGGLTVAKQCYEKLPNETICYIGDTKRCPYGSRTIEEIRAFTWQMVEFLLSKDVKMIVIACNTATAVVLTELQEKLSIPVVGVIQPGAADAVKKTRNHSIGVIATESTVKSNAYTSAIRHLSSKERVFSLACPTFVPLVESNEYHSFAAEEEVNNSLASIAHTDIDTLILGCTHYPLLSKHIQKAVGNDVSMVDPGEATICEVQQQLKQYDLLNASTVKQLNHQLYVTGDIEKFSTTVSDWMGLGSFDIEHVILE